MSKKELRELDAWIAEHVMGDKPDPTKSVPFSSEQYCHPHYTTDPAAAMILLEKCADMTTPSIRKQSDGGFCIWFDHPPMQENYIIAKTLPLAIALFAKKLFTK